MTGAKRTDGMGDADELIVSIWRGKDSGGLVEYRVPARPNQTVLDVVTEVQRRHEPALAYRFACRVGVCGSCAMTVNGVPRWTCRTHIRKAAADGRLTIEPLRNMPRIKDLACDMSEFSGKWQKAGGRFEGSLYAARSARPGRSAKRKTPRRRCGHRVHQLRGVLQRLRCRCRKPRLSRPGGA
jgi:fumarate reductase iron-sulfur subunit